jgi:hypothetical protein
VGSTEEDSGTLQKTAEGWCAGDDDMMEESKLQLPRRTSFFGDHKVATCSCDVAHPLYRGQFVGDH